MSQPIVCVDASLMLPVLQQVSHDRFKKAVDAWCEGSLTITLTRKTDTELRAVVRNGTGKDYGITLTAAGAFCSCPDALYRGVICKHAAVVALVALRQEEIPLPPRRFTLGDRVCQHGNPEQHGTVVCVSGDLISVMWMQARLLLLTQQLSCC